MAHCNALDERLGALEVVQDGLNDGWNLRFLKIILI
jgi:hypothetical protein